MRARLSPLRIQRFTLVVGVLAFAAAGIAETGGYRPDPPVPASELKLSSGQIELARLVDLASQRLGVKVTYDEQLLKSKVTLRLPSALSDRELWDLTNRLLAEQGLVTARLGGTADPALAIVKIATAAQLAQAESFEPVAPPHASTDIPSPAPTPAQFLPSFRKLAVKLAHISSKDAAAAIGSLLSKPSGTVTEDPSGHSLIISDLRAHAETAAKAAVVMDVPSLEVQVAEHKCTNLATSVLVTLATQVVTKRDAIGGSSGSSAATGSGAAQSASRGSGELIAAPDGRTLLVIAPADKVDSWLDLLARLDQRGAVDTRRYAAGTLPATEAARLIEQTVAASRASQPASDVSDDRWTVAADDASGTLLVTGTPSQHALVDLTLAGLAAAPPEIRRPLKTFVLKHRSVREVIGIIDRLSSFTGSATANLPPPRQENSITSIATIPDGYTVVVGGLEAITDGEGESRVPGLGASPVDYAGTGDAHAKNLAAALRIAGFCRNRDYNF